MWTCCSCGNQVESQYFDFDERICDKCAEKRDNRKKICDKIFAPIDEICKDYEKKLLPDIDLICPVCKNHQVITLADGDRYCLICKDHVEGGENV